MNEWVFSEKALSVIAQGGSAGCTSLYRAHPELLPSSGLFSTEYTESIVLSKALLRHVRGECEDLGVKIHGAAVCTSMLSLLTTYNYSTNY
jgi:hypothetical protein